MDECGFYCVELLQTRSETRYYPHLAIVLIALVVLSRQFIRGYEWKVLR